MTSVHYQSNVSLDKVDIHPFEMEWEKSFRWNTFGPLLANTMPLAFVIAISYVILVFAGQRWMRDRKPFDLKGPLIWWNGFLTVLSWIMAFRMVPALVQRLMNWDFADTICDKSFSEGTTGLWVFIFTASKVPELLDTMFLVLRKKPVILLHWYHHFTVLLYTWYAYSLTMPAGPLLPPGGLWFCAMNSFVHAFMYLYYFETARGKRPSWNMIITIIQISQMVVGSYITARDLFSEHCAPSSSTWTGVGMYFSYFLLFVHLFYNTYCTGKDKARKAAAKAKTNGTNGVTNGSHSNGSITNGNGHAATNGHSKKIE